MSVHAAQYQAIEKRLTNWMSSRSDVRDIVIVGSRAVQSPPPDPWADLDLIIFSAEPRAFLENPGWIDTLGDVWFHVFHHTFAGDPEWMVWLAPGLKVDLTVAPAVSDLESLLRDSSYKKIFRRGYRLLGAAHGQDLAHEETPESQLDGSLTFHEFTAACSAVLHLAGKAALLLRRGDLWRAKLICDGELKSWLAVLVGLHSGSGGDDKETWVSGRNLENWADPDVAAVLPGAFSVYERDDIWRGLFATLEIYRLIRKEIAERRDWPVYPAGETAFFAWLSALDPRR